MTRLRRAAVAFLGLLLGLFVIEGMFRLRDHGAFPHLNIYRPDGKLGVRLQPGAREKISFSDNPVSSVRINAQGYRGADWPASQANEIFIVGDSQAFGLGVDEEDAFAWKLGALTGRPVANAAVPTYGPDEYNAVLAEELPRRKPKTVVYVVNLANDLFEASHPNPTRHVVWDGWAVRKETAPRGIRHFPGRRLLFTDSHAFFALRGLWFKWSAVGDEGAVPSEGTWRDLVDATHVIEKAAATAAQAPKVLTEDMQVRRALAEAIESHKPGYTPHAGILSVLSVARAHPGDIVLRSFGEGSRAVSLTADQIFEATNQRNSFEQDLRAHHDDAKLEKLAELDSLATAKSAPAPIELRSPLYAQLARAKQLCDANGAELVVLVLPLDVQVSAAEWAKYPASRKVDLSGSRVLSWDVLIAAGTLGARTVDAWDVLVAAEPGAFLRGDLHMTPKGHAAVAAALARALKRPVPRAHALPPGRSAVPSPAEWAEARALSGTGRDEVGLSYGVTLDKLGCVYKRLREWAQVSCRGGGFTQEEPSAADVLIVNSESGGNLTTAVLEGQQLVVDFVGKDAALRFHFSWPLMQSSRTWIDGPSTYGLVKHAFQITPADKVLCACQKKVTGAADCNALYGAAEPGCVRAYSDDCESLLECARGDEDAPPRCQPTETTNAVTGRCVASAK